MFRRVLAWLFGTAVIAATALAVAFALGFILAVAALHIAFFLALGLFVVGLLAIQRGGGHRMSLGDAGVPEETAHDAAEMEREMRTIRTEGAPESVRGNRTVRLSFGTTTWIGAGAALLLICILFG